MIYQVLAARETPITLVPHMIGKISEEHQQCSTAYMVMAYIVMAVILIAVMVVAYRVMACIFMVYVV